MRRSWHQIRPQICRRAGNGFKAGSPFSEILFGIVEDLARLVGVLERGPGVAWDHGGVVQEVQDAAAVAREEDLLLGALDDGGEVDVVGFFQLLTSLFLIVNDFVPFYTFKKDADLRYW